MPDSAEDKEKAEKVAAARKRYEQLKKQKAKKGGKKEAKTADKPDEAAEPETAESSKDDAGNDGADAAAEDDKAAAIDESKAESVAAAAVATTIEHDDADAGAGAASEKVQDLYRKQVARIEQLEKTNKRLHSEADESSSRLKKLEAEAEELRDAQGGLAELKSKAVQADEHAAEVTKLKQELSALQRQSSYMSKDSRRKSSTSVPRDTGEGDSKAQLAAKTSTIESLELEISNLRHTLSISESQQAELNSRISGLESQLSIAEQSSAELKQELEDLRLSNRPTSSTSADTDSQTDSETRIKDLKASLAASQKSSTEAVSRATNLEKKIEVLTSLHRDSEARNQTQAAARSKELERLRNEANDMRKKLGSVSNENARLREVRASRSSSLVSNPGVSGEINDEDAGQEEKHKLQARVRELESEVFELKRGVWRERRKELQPGGSGDGEDGEDELGAGSTVFDDIDLDTPASATHKGGLSSTYGAFSSMLNAFTGGAAADARRPSATHQAHHKQQHGHENGTAGDDDDEFEFDEAAFQAAQHEEQQKRLERIREIKRGLKEFEGFRVDLVDLRGGPMAGVFDV